MAPFSFLRAMKTIEWHRFFKHFEPEEYLSPGGLVLFHKKNIIPFDPIILLAIEQLRDSLNYNRNEGHIYSKKEITLVINTGDQNLRGFVTPEEWYFKRPREKDQIYSFHLWCAADLHSPELPIYTLFHYAKLQNFPGLIRHSGYIHADYRTGEPYVKE